LRVVAILTGTTPMLIGTSSMHRSVRTSGQPATRAGERIFPPWTLPLGHFPLRVAWRLFLHVMPSQCRVAFLYTSTISFLISVFELLSNRHVCCSCVIASRVLLFCYFSAAEIEAFYISGARCNFNFNFKVTDRRAFMTSLLKLTSSNERLNNEVVHISTAYSMCFSPLPIDKTYSTLIIIIVNRTEYCLV